MFDKIKNEKLFKQINSVMELTKSQKKIARELISTGLQRECKTFLEKIETFMQNPRYKADNPHEVYLKLYKKVAAFDKHIARRYNGMIGSRYYITVLSLFVDKVLSLEDIAAFDEETQNGLIKLAKTFEE